MTKIFSFIQIKEDKGIKKPSLQVLSLGLSLKKKFSFTHCVIVFEPESDEVVKHLADFSVDEIFFFENIPDTTPNMDVNIFKELGIDKTSIVLFNSSSLSISLAPKLSAKYNLSINSGITSTTINNNSLVLKKLVFSGKAFANMEVNKEGNVIVINPNTHPIQKASSPLEPNINVISDANNNHGWKILETNKTKGKVSLPEADLVVSGGRGLKGPENWGMIEELAEILGANTACSRPVSDSDWRPHHEHVGQTGITIRPSLYIAIGISGAIQHLAGVNSSKVIVVINKDPEAPFFKSADYGIVGDAFEVVPKLIEALQKNKVA